VPISARFSVSWTFHVNFRNSQPASLPLLNLFPFFADYQEQEIKKNERFGGITPVAGRGHDFLLVDMQAPSLPLPLLHIILP